MSELISVIVPAYNAAATLDETLHSVRGQTHADFEALVVDDGSADATPDLVEAHVAADPRVRLIRQANGGVARARNRGLAEARGRLVAPVDADDLWSPDKLAKQLAAYRAEREGVVLVYSWFNTIDEQGRILSGAYRPTEKGDVLRRMLRGNLIGNASTPLMRRDAVLAVGGYDPSLRDRRAQGCEDLLLYFRLAEQGRFGLVPEALVGYRWTAENMSSDGLQMMRSWALVADEMRSRHPDHEADIRAGGDDLLWWLAGRAYRAGRRRDAFRLVSRLTRSNAGMVADKAARAVSRHVLQRVKRALRPTVGADRPAFLSSPGEAR